MRDLVTFFLTLCEVIILTSCQRVAPGVPPQQYQQPPVPTQQYQQQVPQQHYQQVQVPVQQQHQVPVQQYQQVPMQQVPSHGMPPPVQVQAHAQQPHHPHGQPQQILNAANIVHEKQHIQEHLEVPIDTSKMTDQELQFHYFKMHDADNNNKLDGCELIKSLIHWHEQGHKDPHNQVPTGEDKLFKDEELTALIDPILSMDDTNMDGFIDYPEFIQAQQKAAAKPGP